MREYARPYTKEDMYALSLGIPCETPDDHDMWICFLRNVTQFCKDHRLTIQLGESIGNNERWTNFWDAKPSNKFGFVVVGVWRQLLEFGANIFEANDGWLQLDPKQYRVTATGVNVFAGYVNRDEKEEKASVMCDSDATDEVEVMVPKYEFDMREWEWWQRSLDWNGSDRRTFKGNEEYSSYSVLDGHRFCTYNYVDSQKKFGRAIRRQTPEVFVDGLSKLLKAIVSSF